MLSILPVKSGLIDPSLSKWTQRLTSLRIEKLNAIMGSCICHFLDKEVISLMKQAVVIRHLGSVFFV